MRPGKDRHLRLEVQHAAEALHPRQQHRQVVLESRGVVRRGAQGSAAAVRHRLLQGAAAGLQGFTGYVLLLLLLLIDGDDDANNDSSNNNSKENIPK